MTKPNPGAKTPRALAWRLHTVMSERGIRTAAELYRRLQPYGIDITIYQLTRIVACLPTRLNTQVLGALMAELRCDASDLLQLGAPRQAPLPVMRPLRAHQSTTKTAAPPATPLNVLGPGVSSLARGSRGPERDEAKP